MCATEKLLNGIVTIRQPGQDAVTVAAELAKRNGTRLSGNMRWYEGWRQGDPPYREIDTQDGRIICVLEPID